jgi:hypothetical protein
MVGYIDKAQDIVKSIDHYCTYGAENWDIEADRHLSRLNELLQKAHEEQAAKYDEPIIRSMYKEQKQRIEDLKGGGKH